MTLPPLVRALRPHQWSKNVFVLAAIGFALGDRSLGVDHVEGAIIAVLFAFGAFSLASSSIYVLNDLLDVESDRLHPEKRLRPIAAGELSTGAAKLAAIGCAVGAAVLAVLAGGDPTPVWAILAGYVAINVAYSFGLKRIVLVDVFCIATGFLLRVAVGGAAAGIELSRWLLLCTLFLALFLGLNKRRAEIALLGDAAADHRANLSQYSTGFLDQMISVMAACTIVCYTLYTVDPVTAAKFGEGNRLVWSVPFVVFGLGRYMLLARSGTDTGNPTKVFLGGDRLFALNTLAWLAVVVAVLAGLI
ncbi:decaprenyl-phosphate phosphoribosyltransferase [Engelhardtia mirabilis]|uniref:Decaprenyl-phosphate phosphoribosyltransferase n=1 Tax=Engelhardtia mirabilis TaxID=2528011 RepID=A0A518BLQ1_9BACT|nr:Decaprenyl-phosphate phosphoribosyltransferase [Planctomycetes bacterium Pla133]QDV02231.1 Decaprenyl-phosphate phosphoribosyltransferase [Planctomycetes bacterium Pla86]